MVVAFAKSNACNFAYVQGSPKPTWAVLRSMRQPSRLTAVPLRLTSSRAPPSF